MSGSKNTGKISNIVMVGAGGALVKDDEHAVRIGDFCSCSKSIRGGDVVDISGLSNVTVWVPESTQNINIHTSGANSTVDSPLEENEHWLNTQRESCNNVDVETFHILKAIKEHSIKNETTNLNVVSGVFVSDIVGLHPLTEKISTDQAWKNMGDVIGQYI